MQIDPNLRALNRFGLGARPGERSAIDARAWLSRQVRPEAALLRDPNLDSTQTIINDLVRLREQGKRSKETRQAVRQAGRKRAGDEMQAALSHAVTTDAPFAERLVRFWGNHFAVSMQSEQLVGHVAGAYEREAIRPHVFGRFEDMVLATSMHPAMLIYLDQVRSIGPNSKAGSRNGRGLNENYARELMELHTLGVDGGYTQTDVEQLALMLTGWTVGGVFRGQSNNKPQPFMFLDRVHEPGAKTLLNRRFAEAGVEEGRRAISMLCQHPATATFIATKLVRHFVADQPHPLDVDYIARVFARSNGDLRAVSLALIDLDGALHGEQRKFRTPQEFLIAAARALGLKTLDRKAVRTLQSMRHVPWSPSSPAGYGDTIVDWADPDSLLRRADLAQQLAKMMRRQSVDVRAILADTVESSNAKALADLIAQQATPQLQLALLVASPDFQWR